MAHLWMMDRSEWCVAPLDRDEVSLAGLALARLGERWTLMTPPGAGAAVNGLPVVGGLVVLRDRDEIRPGGHDPIYFSSERLAEVIAMPELGREIRCPRCKRAVPTGTPAARCPGCGLYHHQDPGQDMACWTYGSVCGNCPQPTADLGFRWVPESPAQ